MISMCPQSHNRVAVSLALPDTKSCLAALNKLAGQIELAEIRLDLMESFDLRQLIAESPCELIITCRPTREGGRFTASENDRLAILQEAIALNCAYVDVEWDALPFLTRPAHSKTKILASRHWFETVPSRKKLGSIYEELQAQADAVKLVWFAHQLADVEPFLALFQQADSPLVAIAMGAAGQLTRLMAPIFPACLLTYGGLTSKTGTAAGQLTVHEMLAQYQLSQVGPETAVYLHLLDNDQAAEEIISMNQATPGQQLHIPLRVSDAEARYIAQQWPQLCPQLHLRAW